MEHKDNSKIDFVVCDDQGKRLRLLGTCLVHNLENITLLTIGQEREYSRSRCILISKGDNLTYHSPLVIYHQHSEKKPCPDGILCAWILKRRYPNAIFSKCIAGQFSEWLKVEEHQGFLKADTNVIFVDVCPSLPSELEQLANQVNSIQIIDHHESTRQVQQKLESLTATKNLKIGWNINTELACCEIVWNHFYKGEHKSFPSFFQGIANQDMNREMDSSMSALVRFYQQNDLYSFSGIDWMVQYLDCQATLFASINLGKLLLKQDETLLSTYLSSIKISKHSLGATQILMVECDKEFLYQRLCSLIFKHYPDASLIIIWSLNDKSSQHYNYSFRSNKLDMNQFAKTHFGGGGHCFAAGAIVTSAQHSIMLPSIE